MSARPATPLRIDDADDDRRHLVGDGVFENGIEGAGRIVGAGELVPLFVANHQRDVNRRADAVGENFEPHLLARLHDGTR